MRNLFNCERSRFFFHLKFKIIYLYKLPIEPNRTTKVNLSWNLNVAVLYSKVEKNRLFIRREIKL